jgi:FkbM family methyltransferase
MQLEIPHNCQIGQLSEILGKFFDLESKTKKTFVEVGAFDGYNFSNTFALSKIGWEGIYIEPIPDFAQACANVHSFNSGIKTVCCAIGEIEGNATIAVAGTLSTLSKDNLKAYSEIEWAKKHLENTYVGNVEVPVYRLETVLRVLDVKTIDLLVVDVEGLEESVFKSFSFSEFLPKMIICEIEDCHEDLSKYESIKRSNERVRNHISNASYVEVYRDQINTVFVHKSISAI